LDVRLSVQSGAAIVDQTMLRQGTLSAAFSGSVNFVARAMDLRIVQRDAKPAAAKGAKAADVETAGATLRGDFSAPLLRLSDGLAPPSP
jgi:hypothetical protein